MELTGKPSQKRNLGLGEACSQEREEQMQRLWGGNILGVNEQQQEGLCGSGEAGEGAVGGGFKHIVICWWACLAEGASEMQECVCGEGVVAATTPLSRQEGQLSVCVCVGLQGGFGGQTASPQ